MEHTHHGEIVVAAHGVDVDGAPYFLGVLVVLLADVGVGELRLKRLLGWELLFIYFLPTVHILVRVHPLPHE